MATFSADFAAPNKDEVYSKVMAEESLPVAVRNAVVAVVRELDKEDRPSVTVSVAGHTDDKQSYCTINASFGPKPAKEQPKG